MIAAGALIVIDTETSPRSMPAEQRLHVVERVDRDALAADLAERARVVGVVAHQRGHVERRREARLAVVEQVAEALVGLLARAEAGELAHRPQAAAVHRGVDAARVGVVAGQPDRVLAARRRPAGRSAGVYSSRTGSPESVRKLPARSRASAVVAACALIAMAALNATRRGSLGRT